MVLFFDNAAVKIVRRDTSGDQELWSGRVWLNPVSATAMITALETLNVRTSHRCHGVPHSIKVRRKDRLIWGDRDMEIVLPTETVTGFLGSTGWDLLLLED